MLVECCQGYLFVGRRIDLVTEIKIVDIARLEVHIALDGRCKGEIVEYGRGNLAELRAVCRAPV